MKNLHRRKFMKSAAVLSGAAICGMTAVKGAMASEVDTSGQSVPALPWGYEELDPEYIRKLGHLGYYAFECGGGAYWALMTALKEKIGYPYTLIPLPTKTELIAHLENKSKNKPHLQVMMQYGVGGMANYGTVCGAPNGASNAISTALPIDPALDIIARVLRFYETTSFPSDKSNEYATQHAFLPPKVKTDKALPQSSSHSALCHVSVAKWCERTGYASGSKERSERCARVTGDIAAMAATLANAHLSGDINTVFPMKISQDTASCRSCHYKGDKYEEGQFARGMMECGSCHTDMAPHRGENKLKTAYGAGVDNWAGAAVVGTVAGVGALSVARRNGKGGDHEDE